MTPPLAARTAVVTDPAMRHPNHLGHLVASALRRHRDRPVLQLGGTTLTGGETAEAVSRYVRAFEALGVGTGAPSALLSLNRPEVLLIIAAGQMVGSRRTALHPLGSLDDHAYAIDDAGITTLIIDPVPAFVERAMRLLDRVPGLKQVLTIGAVPEGLAGTGARDLVAAAAGYPPAPLRPAPLSPDHAVVACGCRVPRPDPDQGRFAGGAARLRPG